MKTRIGFVSNSSSSSFIVDFYLKKDKFYEILNKEFDKNNFNNYLNHKIEESTDFINSREVSEDGISDIMRTYSKEAIEFYKKIKELSETDSFEAYKNFYKIEVFEKELGDIDKISFHFKTIMHNYYNDSIPELIKELILYFSAEKIGLVDITRIDTH